MKLNVRLMKIRSSIIIIFTVCALLGCQRAGAQEYVTLGFYNVENLFDTIPSPFHNDKTFTPEGKYRWNTERYCAKIANLARVIDDMDLDVLGLAEVENEAVVRDLVIALKTDYNYIHRQTKDPRGIDVAMLYKGDKFIPDSIAQVRSRSRREFLVVKGRLLGERVNIIVCHLPSKMNKESHRESVLASLLRTVARLRSEEDGARVVVMGDLNCNPTDNVFLKTFGRDSAGYYNNSRMWGGMRYYETGVGSYAYRDRWSLLDNILLSESLVVGDGFRYKTGGVFVREYMVQHSDLYKPSRWEGYPLRTITSGRYTGGYSDHLPVFVVLER